MRYFRPKSVTWWAGVFSISLGVLMILTQNFYVLPDDWDAILPEVAKIIVTLLGGYDTSPGMLIATGMGLIGIRDKLERMNGV